MVLKPGDCASRSIAVSVKCVVGRWKDGLDKEDRAALNEAIHHRKRADLHALICEAGEGRPFGLTALKQHLNLKCTCER